MKSNIVHLTTEIVDLGLERDTVGVVRESSEAISHVFFLRIREVVPVENVHLREVDPSGYGDSHPQKICNVCHKILPTTQFEPNQNGKGDRQVRRPSCKMCRRTIDGVAMAASERRKWLANKPDQVDFQCPICKKITIAGLTSKVVLNHDHATGRVLGWLCDSCNTGLGRFKDDIGILNEAIEYLRTH